MRQGFTLLELIIVIIIIGILGALGFAQYTKMVEKARAAEARDILGQIRSSQEAYSLEYGNYTATLGNLAAGAPTACTTTHYFSYSSSATVGTATRCTTGGKTPNAPVYTVSINYAAGTWGGSAGY